MQIIVMLAIDYAVANNNWFVCYNEGHEQYLKVWKLFQPFRQLLA